MASFSCVVVSGHTHTRVFSLTSLDGPASAAAVAAAHAGAGAIAGVAAAPSAGDTAAVGTAVADATACGSWGEYAAECSTRRRWTATKQHERLEAEAHPHKLKEV